MLVLPIPFRIVSSIVLIFFAFVIYEAFFVSDEVRATANAKSQAAIQDSFRVKPFDADHL